MLVLLQLLVTNLLLWHVRWCLEACSSLSPQSASWLYALTARLQRPLTQDVMAALRQLLRHCAKLRWPSAALAVFNVHRAAVTMNYCQFYHLVASERDMFPCVSVAVQGGGDFTG